MCELSDERVREFRREVTVAGSIKDRPEEEWARRVIAAELRCLVEFHDDGSEDGMYDLRVGDSSSPRIAIEVTAAVDRLRTETWKAGPGQGPWRLAVPGNWIVILSDGANIKRLRRELPGLLQELCIAEATTFASFEMLEWRDSVLHARAHSLGILGVDQSVADGDGTVHFSLGGEGGPVDGTGAELSRWIGEFLRDPGRADVLQKLGRVSAPQREVFVPVALDGAPWGVVSYLTDLSTLEFCVPAAQPDLPALVTGVWVASVHSFGRSIGVRWSDGVWRTFRTCGPDIDC